MTDRLCRVMEAAALSDFINLRRRLRVFGYLARSMGDCRRGQRHLSSCPLPLENAKAVTSVSSVVSQIRFNYSILIRTKRTKIVAKDTFNRLKIYLNAFAAGALPQTPLGSLQRSLRPPSSI